MNIINEKSFFLQILSDYLNSRNSASAEPLNWKTVIEYARIHRVLGIVYTQAKDLIPTEDLGEIKKDVAAIVWDQYKKIELLNNVLSELNNNHIPYFIIKGPLLAELYPTPVFRAMGDIDLVVHTEDREKCHSIMIHEGFQCMSKNESREWQYFKNRIEFEVHDRLVYDESVNESGQADFFNDCWKYTYSNGSIDWNFHLLFLVFHVRKHLMGSGAGFRHFLDLAIVAKKVDLDWDWINHQLEKTHMLSFAGKCFGFINRWWGIETPIMESIDDEFYELVTDKTFDDGIWGLHNKKNANNYVINMVRKKNNQKFEMLKLAVRQILPSWNDLHDTEPYTYLKYNRLLLPIAWIQRGIRGLTAMKYKIVIEGIRKSFVSDDSIARQEDFLKKWGL